LSRIHVAIIRFLLEDFDRLNSFLDSETTSSSALIAADEDMNGAGGKNRSSSSGGGGSKTQKTKKKKTTASNSNTRSGLAYYANDDSDSDYEMNDDNDISLKKGAGGAGGPKIPRSLVRKVTFSDLYCDSCGERERFMESELKYLTALTWPTVLRRLLLTNSIGALLRRNLSTRAIAIAAMLGDNEYALLPPAMKLELLKGLIDAVIATDSFNSLMHRLGNELADEISKIESEREAEESRVKERIKNLKESLKEREKDTDPFIKLYYQREVKLKDDNKKATAAAAATTTTTTTGGGGGVSAAVSSSSTQKGVKSSSTTAVASVENKSDMTDDEDTTTTTSLTSSSKREVEKKAMTLSLLIDAARSHDLFQIDKALFIVMEAGFQ
jgi:hypothetical protein